MCIPYYISFNLSHIVSCTLRWRFCSIRHKISAIWGAQWSNGPSLIPCGILAKEQLRTEHYLISMLYWGGGGGGGVSGLKSAFNLPRSYHRPHVGIGATCRYMQVIIWTCLIRVNDLCPTVYGCVALKKRCIEKWYARSSAFQYNLKVALFFFTTAYRSIGKTQHCRCVTSTTWGHYNLISDDLSWT